MARKFEGDPQARITDINGTRLAYLEAIAALRSHFDDHTQLVYGSIRSLSRSHLVSKNQYAALCEILLAQLELDRLAGAAMRAHFSNECEEGEKVVL